MLSSGHVPGHADISPASGPTTRSGPGPPRRHDQGWLSSLVGSVLADAGWRPRSLHDSIQEVGVLGVNHIAFRSHDPGALRRFYLDLTGAEPLDGVHNPVRVGHTVLVFFASERRYSDNDPDEFAFDVDASGFDDVLQRAKGLGALNRGPVQHTEWSKGFYVTDPDGRRLEFTCDDHSVYWT